MDTHARSWAKSFSWRVTGVVILGAITYLATRSWEKTGAITALFHVIRLVLYYWHERLWERVVWGKLKHPLADLPVRNDLTAQDLEVISSFLHERRYSTREPEYQI